MTTLITGGTGKTGSALAEIFHAAKEPFLIASRKGTSSPGFPAVKFDWDDPTTFENPFNADKDITRLYLLLPPPAADNLETVKPFLDLAVEKGVKRIVLLTGSKVVKGTGSYGEVWAYRDTFPGLEFAVLKPTWFSDNFATAFLPSIQGYDCISSATGEGRIPFVTAQDVAQAAYDKLTEAKSTNGEFFVIGPELFTYDEALALLSEIVGRKIVHKKITEDEAFATYKSFGMQEEHARLLAELEVVTSKGSESQLQDKPNTVIGKVTLREYFTANRNVWVKG